MATKAQGNPAKTKKSADNAVYRKTIGGMCGGLCEALSLHPLDTIKTRLQLSGRRTGLAGEAPIVYKGIVDCGQQIAKHEGFAGLYKGLSPFVVHLVSKYALRFYTNFKIRELIAGGPGKETTIGACCRRRRRRSFSAANSARRRGELSRRPIAFSDL